VRHPKCHHSDDRNASTPVVIVSESIVTRYFGGQAIGKRINRPRIEIQHRWSRVELPVQTRRDGSTFSAVQVFLC